MHYAVVEQSSKRKIINRKEVELPGKTRAGSFQKWIIKWICLRVRQTMKQLR